MIPLDTLRPGQGFLLAETVPGQGQVEAEVVYLRSQGPALLFSVVHSTDQEIFPRGALVVRLAGNAQRWCLSPLGLEPPTA